MDFVFHGASAALLARCLGETRPRHLLYAALVGVSPDALWAVTMLPGCRFLYSYQHSLFVNLPVCLIICCFNWRIAFGGLLHLFFDIFTHKSSTMHLFYPFARPQLPIGLAWWSWPGILLWAGLWCGLLLTLFLGIRKSRNRHSGSYGVLKL